MNSNHFWKAAAAAVGFFLAWYAGAMFNFLPFLGNDLCLRAVGFTGLLLCILILCCTCRIIKEIRKAKDAEPKK